MSRATARQKALATALEHVTRIKSATAALGDLHARQRQLQRDLDDERALIASRVEAEKRDAAKRILDGEASAPPKPRRVTAIANAKARIDGIEAALPELAQHIAAAEQAVKSARSEFNAAVAGIVMADKAGAAEALKDALRSIREPLAMMIAAQAVQLATIGGTFEAHGFPDPAALYDGDKLAARIMAALPDFLTPAELNRAGIGADAAALAKSTLTELEVINVD